ncbi:MAG: PfkB family carbohydrate kinase [Trueperaceae bacterium]|nr:PfkB family carbohydrate kinase [Trueperaceae bacterium]
MRRAPRVLCVGLSCLDMVWEVAHFPPRASRTPARTHARRGGGPAATAAVAAARYGAEVALWAVHGDDEAGPELDHALRAEAVDTRWVRVPPGARSFVSAVLVAPDGERWIFPYRGEGLNDDPDWWPLPQVAEVDALLTDLRHPRLARAALLAAREANVPTVVDLGRAEDATEAMTADHVVAAREAAERIGRDAAAPQPLLTPEGALDVAAAAEALARLRTRPAQWVAITLGAAGVIYDAGDGPRHLPAPRAQVHDTTGAGDVFHGVWAAAVASGAPADVVARHASYAAAASCQGPGRSRIPGGDEVRHAVVPAPSALAPADPKGAP